MITKSKNLQALPTTEDRPNQEVKIADCGAIEDGADFGVCANDGTEDVYPHHPGDLDLDWYLMSNFKKVLEIINNIKASGNHFYKAGDNRAAVKKYRKALKYISHLRDSMGSTEDVEEEQIRAVEVPACLNMAAALLRTTPRTQEGLEEAKKQCENVLEIEPDNAKALFRRGQVGFWKQDYADALADLARVRELQPGDKGVLLEIEKVKKARAALVQKEKSMYGKMFK